MVLKDPPFRRSCQAGGMSPSESLDRFFVSEISLSEANSVESTRAGVHLKSLILNGDQTAEDKVAKDRLDVFLTMPQISPPLHRSPVATKSQTLPVPDDPCGLDRDRAFSYDFVSDDRSQNQIFGKLCLGRGLMPSSLGALDLCL